MYKAYTMQPKTNLAIGINTPRKDRTELKNHVGKPFICQTSKAKSALHLSLVLRIVLEVVELNVTSLKQICHLVTKGLCDTKLMFCGVQMEKRKLVFRSAQIAQYNSPSHSPGNYSAPTLSCEILTGSSDRELPHASWVL